MNSPRRALVIGGGIAGPALALFLKRAGLEPAVFEAYPRADDVGGGLQIAPNGARVLAALGLDAALLQTGHAAHGFVFRNHHGKVIGRTRTDRAGIAINTGRAPLQRLLRDALEREGIAIRYDRRLRELTFAGDEVVATFDDGTTEVGDLLVGADGVRSRVRAAILPEFTQPRYTGMVSLGGFCAPGFVPSAPHADTENLTFVVGPSHQLGYGQMTDRHWGWWCHAQAESDADRAAFVALPPEALRARMMDRYRGWSSPIAELIAATEEWLVTPIFDVPSLPTWHRGRVVLLGDAAHAMSPAGGQGASMALGDAIVLANLLARNDAPLETLFARFEAARRPSAEAFVKQGYANDRRTLQTLGPMGQWFRDRLMMPLMASFIERTLVKHYVAPLEA